MRHQKDIYNAVNSDIALGNMVAEAYAKAVGIDPEKVSIFCPAWRHPMLLTLGEEDTTIEQTYVLSSRFINDNIPNGIIVHKKLNNIHFGVYVNDDEYFLMSSTDNFGRLNEEYKSFVEQLTKVEIPKPKIFLEDGILDKVLESSIEYLKFVNKYDITASRGIIVYGPPGNGKSLLCKEIINHCRRSGINHERFNNSDTRSLLRASRSGVYILDDMDINLFSRKKEPVFASTFLSIMDGSIDIPRVFILTTNEDVGTMDKAFLRPGRFDLTIKLDKPSEKLRKAYIESWEIDIDADKLTKASNGLSFAELYYIRNLILIDKYKNGDGSLDKALNEYSKRLQHRSDYLNSNVKLDGEDDD